MNTKCKLTAMLLSVAPSSTILRDNKTMDTDSDNNINYKVNASK